MTFSAQLKDVVASLDHNESTANRVKLISHHAMVVDKQVKDLKLSSDMANKHFNSWEAAAEKASTTLKELGDVAHWTTKLEGELDIMERALSLAKWSRPAA